MKSLRIFISSPGDVAQERQIAGKVLERLQGKYWSFVRLDDVFWEQRAVRATAHYQDELVDPGACEMVVGVLAGRLGRPLPEKFAMLAGATAPTGTEWELERAFAAHEASRASLEASGRPAAQASREAKPDILIYRRKPSPKPETLDEEGRRQLDQLEAYLRQNYVHDDGTIKRPVLSYRSLEEFEDKLQNHLEELILRAIPTLQPGFDPPPISGNPFLGLKPFGYDDSDRFFGRNRAIREVQDLLLRRAEEGRAFVLIYGASGYGKSSLMRAGLAPRLTRPGGAGEGMDRWRRVLLQPARGTGPLCERLARALLAGPSPEEREQAELHEHYALSGLPEQAADPIGDPDAAPEDDGPTPCWDVGSLARYLADGEDMVFAVAAVLSALERGGLHLLLQIDQLEEVFAEGVEAGERAAFFRALQGLSRCGRVWTLATMRSEFFGRIAGEAELRSLIGKDGGYILQPPDLQSWAEIIRLPALAARLEWERALEPVEVRPGEFSTEEWLNDQILAEVRDNPGALPLLEFCLERLYRDTLDPADPEGRRVSDRMRWEAYRGMRGLAGAIATEADRVYGMLSPSERDAGRYLFAALVRVEENVSRRRVDRAQLEGRPGAKAFLDAFLEAKLLVTDAEGGKTVVTLAHESLLSHWPVLAQWIGEHRGDLAAHQRLIRQTELWKENGRSRKYLLSEGHLAEAERVASRDLFSLGEDEAELLRLSQGAARKRLRRLRLAVAGFAVLAAGALAGGGFAWKKQREAEREKNEADKQRRLVQTERDVQGSILWQNSLNSWAAAEEAYQDGRPRDALALLAAGMKSAPSNTRLVPFAVSILEEIDHGLRELRMDRPLLGITVTPWGIITAEAEFTDKLHFCLRHPHSLEIQDAIEIPQAQITNLRKDSETNQDDNVIRRELRDHPWLHHAQWSFDNAPFWSGDKIKFKIQNIDGNKSHVQTEWVERGVWNSEDRDTTIPWYWYVPGGPDERMAGWKVGYEQHDVPLGRGFAFNLNDTLEPRLAEVKEMASNEWPTRLEPSSKAIGNAPGHTIRIGPMKIQASPDGSLMLIGSQREIPMGYFAGTFLAIYHPRVSRLAILGMRKETGDAVLLIVSGEGSLLMEESLKIPELNCFTAQVIFGPGSSLFLAAEDSLYYWPECRAGSRMERPIPAQADHAGWLGSAALSPDGKTLALGYKRQLLLLSVPEFDLIRDPLYHQSIVSSLRFSADGRILVSGSGFNDGSGSDGYAQIWKFPEMEPVGDLLEMVVTGSQYNTSAQVTDLRISQDSSAVAVGSRGGEGSSIRLWDIQTALPLSAFINEPVNEKIWLKTIESFELNNEISVTVSDSTENLPYGHWQYKLALPSKPVPAWFHEALIPYLANQRISETGQRAELGVRDFSALYARLQEVSYQKESDIYTEIMFRFLPSLNRSRPEAAGENSFFRDWSVLLDDLGDFAVARQNYQQALETAQLLAETDPGNTEYQRYMSFAHVKLGDLANAEDDLAAARESFGKSLEIRQRLAEADPRNADDQRDWSVSLTKLGEVAEAQDDLATARESFGKSLEIRQRLAEADPRNAAAQRDWSVSLTNLGDLAKAEDDLATARQAYEKSLAIQQRLAEADPRNADDQRDWSVSLTNLGDLAMAEDDLATARQAYEKSLEIDQRLAESDPRDTNAQRDWGVSLNRLGDVFKAEGDLAGARQAYEKSVEIDQRLAEADPRDTNAQSDWSFSLNRLGDVAKAEDDLATARQAYEKSSAIRQRLAESDPRNADAQSDWSFSLNRLGDVFKAEDDLAGARQAYEKSVEIDQRLAEADPRNAAAQRDWSVSLTKLGKVAEAQDDLATARRAYEKSSAIRQRLAEADPLNVDAQRDWSVSLTKLGDLEKAEGDLVAARQAYERSLEVMERLSQANPGDDQLHDLHAFLLWRLGNLAEAQGDPASAREAYIKCVSIRERLAQADPGNISYQEGLWLVLYDFSLLLEKESAPEARKTWQKTYEQMCLMKDRGVLASGIAELFEHVRQKAGIDSPEE
jgi:tetratricopeptide (TPR) repeat protein